MATVASTEYTSPAIAAASTERMLRATGAALGWASVTTPTSRLVGAMEARPRSHHLTGAKQSVVRVTILPIGDTAPESPPVVLSDDADAGAPVGRRSNGQRSAGRERGEGRVQLRSNANRN